MATKQKPMRNPFKTGTPESFFWTHAGWGYNPATETREAGRKNGAIRLASVESQAREAGVSFEWSIDDPHGSAEWSNRKPAWASWQCLAHGPDGEIVASLYGIDFGPDGEPWGDPYRRVVEAELAAEWASTAEA